MTREERKEYLKNLPTMEEMKSQIDSTMKEFQDETVISCARSFKRITEKIIADTEGIEGLKPADVLGRIVAYADNLIKERTNRKEYMVIHTEWKKYLETLSRENAGVLCKMFIEYGMNGTFTYSGISEVDKAFDEIKAQIDWDNEHPLRHSDYSCDICAHLDICWAEENSNPMCKTEKKECFCSQDVMDDC